MSCRVPSPLRHEIRESFPDFGPGLAINVLTPSLPDSAMEEPSNEEGASRIKSLHDMIILRNHLSRRSFSPQYNSSAEFTSILSYYASKYLQKSYEPDIAELEGLNMSLRTELANLEQAFHDNDLEIPTSDIDMPTLMSTTCTAQRMLQESLHQPSSISEIQELFDRCKNEVRFRKIDLLIENEDLAGAIEVLKAVLEDDDEMMIDPELHTAQSETVGERQDTLAPDQLMIDPELHNERIEMIPERQAGEGQDAYIIEPGPAGERYTHVREEQDVDMMDADETEVSTPDLPNDVEGTAETVDIDRDRAGNPSEVSAHR